MAGIPGSGYGRDHCAHFTPMSGTHTHSHIMWVQVRIWLTKTKTKGRRGILQTMGTWSLWKVRFSSYFQLFVKTMWPGPDLGAQAPGAPGPEDTQTHS